jgi:hypothetical protein
MRNCVHDLQAVASESNSSTTGGKFTERAKR